MSVIESTTGHSRRREKNMARTLYIAIAIAVVCGIVAAIIAGKSSGALNPFSSDQSQQAAPDVGAPPGR